jgi:hypothetical protein
LLTLLHHSIFQSFVAIGHTRHSIRLCQHDGSEIIITKGRIYSTQECYKTQNTKNFEERRETKRVLSADVVAMLLIDCSATSPRQAKELKFRYYTVAIDHPADESIKTLLCNMQPI